MRIPTASLAYREPFYLMSHVYLVKYWCNISPTIVGCASVLGLDTLYQFFSVRRLLENATTAICKTHIQIIFHTEDSSLCVKRLFIVFLFLPFFLTL